MVGLTGQPERIARGMRVPPWLVDHTYPVPRHPRLAWFLLRLRWRIGL